MCIRDSGSTEPTVTDANVVLGRFRPMQPLGGEIMIDVGAARRAIDSLGARLELDRMKTAEGIIQIAVTRMTVAIKEISVMRGIDPREFSLVAYGGAGPLHAALIADELGMAQVVIPPLSGSFSAYGLLVADRRRDRSRTCQVTLTETSVEEIEKIVRPLRDEARQELLDDGFSPDRIRIELSADMRYEGQAYELTTLLPEIIESIDQIEKAFQQAYEERYTHADEGAIEVVSFRVAAYGLTAKPQLPGIDNSSQVDQALAGERPCHFAGKDLTTRIYQREQLPGGARLRGPLLVEESGATTLVPPGVTLESHRSGALVLSLDADNN